MKSSHESAGPVPASDPGPHRRSGALGAGAVLLAATLFAVNGPVSKTVLQHGLDPQQLVEIRSLGAALVFAAIAAVLPSGRLAIRGRELGSVAVYGVVGLAVVNWLYFVAISRMPVSVSLLIEFTAPLWVALWSRFVLRRPIRRRVWAALGLVVVGLTLVARLQQGQRLDGVGVAASVAAALCLAAYYVLGERALAGRDPWSLSAWSFGAAAVVWAIAEPWWRFPFGALVRAAPFRVETLGAGISLPVGLYVVWVVLMGTVAPYALVLVGLATIGPTRTGLVGTSEPPMAGVLSWLVLGEALQPVQIIGAAVVLTGIVLAETARAAPTPTSGPVPSPATSPADVAPDRRLTGAPASSPGDEQDRDPLIVRHDDLPHGAPQPAVEG